MHALYIPSLWACTPKLKCVCGGGADCTKHRHLREIDCSLAIVGGLAVAWAMGLNPRANQDTGPAFSVKAGLWWLAI